MSEPSLVAGWPHAAGFWFALAAICGSCAAHRSREPGEIEGPPFDELFEPVEVDCWDEDLDPVSGLPKRCPRFFFDIAVLERSCVAPDADSFDDYIEFRLNPDGTLAIDPGTGMPFITVPRGKTPVPGSEMCEADGIQTGPDSNTGEYYPSKFCRIPDCEPAAP